MAVTVLAESLRGPGLWCLASGEPPSKSLILRPGPGFGGFSLGDFGRHGSGGIFEGPWALVLAFWRTTPKIAHFEAWGLDFEGFL